MNDSPGLAALLHDYASIAERPYRTLTLDEVDSLKYYNAELDHQNGTLDNSRGALVARWTRDLHDLEIYILRTGTFPRDNRRLPRDAFTHEHRHLITWVNTQLRESNLGNRCTYQVRRLRLVPGYALTSRPDLWESQRSTYLHFVTTPSNGVPSPRSEYEAERHLAQWRARQRAAYRVGRLTDAQVDALESIPGWTWG